MGVLEAEINDMRRISGMEKLSEIERRELNAPGESESSINLNNFENESLQTDTEFRDFDEQEPLYSDSSDWVDSDKSFDFLHDGSNLDILREELNKAHIEYGIPPHLSEDNASIDTQEESRYFEQLPEEATSQSPGCQYGGEGTKEEPREKTEESFETEQHNTRPLCRFSRLTNRRSSSIISMLSPISKGSKKFVSSGSEKYNNDSLIGQDDSLLNLCLDIPGMNKEMMDSIEEKLKLASIPHELQFVYKQVMEILDENSLLRKKLEERQEKLDDEGTLFMCNHKKAGSYSKPGAQICILVVFLLLVSLFLRPVGKGNIGIPGMVEGKLDNLELENKELKGRVKNATNLVEGYNKELRIMQEKNDLRMNQISLSYKLLKKSLSKAKIEFKLNEKERTSLKVVDSSLLNIRLLQSQQVRVESQLQETKGAIKEIKTGLAAEWEKIHLIQSRRKRYQEYETNKQKIGGRIDEFFCAMKNFVMSVQHFIASTLLSDTLFDEKESKETLMILMVYI